MAPLRQHLFAVGYTAALLAGLAVLWVRPNVSDWPAWVQAIGSIAAILAAIGISQWEAGRERRNKREDLQEYRTAVAALARRLADKVRSEAIDLKGSPDWYVYEGLSTSDFDLIDAALDRFDPSKLVSADAVMALEDLRRAAKLVSFYANAVAADARQEQYFEDLHGRIDAWVDRVDRAASVIEELAKAKA